MEGVAGGGRGRGRSREGGGYLEKVGEGGERVRGGLGFTFDTVLDILNGC